MDEWIELDINWIIQNIHTYMYDWIGLMDDWMIWTGSPSRIYFCDSNWLMWMNWPELSRLYNIDDWILLRTELNLIVHNIINIDNLIWLMNERIEWTWSSRIYIDDWIDEWVDGWIDPDGPSFWEFLCLFRYVWFHCLSKEVSQSFQQATFSLALLLSLSLSHTHTHTHKDKHSLSLSLRLLTHTNTHF